MSAINLASKLGENLIMNPTYDIRQRGGDSIGVTGSQYGHDRWYWQTVSSATVDLISSTNVPTETGYPNVKSYQVSVTTPDAAVAAGDYAIINQSIEGYNFRKINNKNFVCSFYVSSPKTGIHCVTFATYNVAVSYVAEYNIVAANVWQKVTVRVKHDDTLGTWDFNNGGGMRVFFTLMAGANQQGAPDVWQETGNAIMATSNQVNVLDAVGSFYVSQVQLHEGIDEIPFQKLARDYNTELALCQRYYQVLGNEIESGAGGIVHGISVNGATVRGQMTLPVAMRTLPALDYNNDADFLGYEDAVSFPVVAIGAQHFSSNYDRIILVYVLTGAILNHTYHLKAINSNAKLYLDAEL